MPSSPAELRPLVVTCGEPAGIGPEVIARARALTEGIPLVVLGNPDHFARLGVAVEVIDAPARVLTPPLCWDDRPARGAKPYA